MELVLYYIKESGSLLISFLILMFVIGILSYIMIRNFRQSSKLKVSFYGLFLGLKNIDIIKITIVILRTFLAFYSVMVLYEEKIYMCLIMISLLSLMYVCLTPKKIIYETVSTVMQIVMIYFVFIINGYMTEVENTSTMLMIKICLIIFVILLATYFLLRNINDIVENRWDKEFKKSRKEVVDGK